MCDLVVRLFLRTSQIEKELAAFSTAFVAIRDCGSVNLAVGTVRDCVLHGAAVGKGRLEVEVDIGVGF